MKTKKIITTILVVILMHSCATYNAQYNDENTKKIFPQQKNIHKTFYLIGDAGAYGEDKTSDGLKGLKLALEKAGSKDYVLFLGDNIYPAGLPKKSDPTRAQAESRMNSQLNALKGFKGQPIFIPGNHDWYSDGVKGVQRQEDYITKALNDKNAFAPGNGCGIADFDISDQVHLVVVDSQWFLANWDKNPTINDDCDKIKTRNDLFDEIDDILGDYEDKTIVFAVHHPLITHGPHGGEYGAKHQFSPIPVIGTLITHIRKSGGVSAQDRFNRQYNTFANRVITLARDANKVVFVSGHEHSLQYNIKDGIHQIISGSGSKESVAKLTNDSQFVYGKQGFARLDIFDDGSSWVRFYTYENGVNKLVYQNEVFQKTEEKSYANLPSNFSAYKAASVYREEQTQKSKFYNGFWGEHYRNIYGVKVKAPVALLDTLYGGLTPLRRGGGHQSKTLRLQDKNGTTYTMRALEKSAVRFLQSTIFKENFVQEEFKNTAPERLLLDFYTAAHPFASFVVADMADAIGVYHTSPKLFYVPKQERLGKYNDEYGDELYMIEIRADDANANEASFGKPDDIENTVNLYKRLRQDEKYILDRNAFVRARLFDMVLGDWDRHQDQWKWAEFEKDDGHVEFVPIPRDRDQAFSNFDGGLFSTLRFFIGPLRMFSEYNETVSHPKWFNFEPTPLDRTLLKGISIDEWLKEAKYIQDNLTDEVIENAFKGFPQEVREDKMQAIITALKARRNNLSQIAEEYATYLNKLVIVTGTDKDDYFEIIRSGNGETSINIRRIKKGEKSDIMMTETFKKDITKEIWIYGLDDDDVFEVKGNGTNLIPIRIIGGQNNDTYIIERGARVKIYDHKSKKNTITKNKGARIKLTDDYETNFFDRKKGKVTTNTLVPGLGFNPDDGFKIGLRFTSLFKGFVQNPFTSKHTLGANVYFATGGLEFIYQGEFARVFGNANLIIGGRASSDNFARNFFGFGSDTPNFDDDLDLDFNRVRIAQLGAHIGIKSSNPHGGVFTGLLKFESFEVERTANRFIEIIFPPNAAVFDQNYFGTAEVAYAYESYDVPLNPSRGMSFNLSGGYTLNLDDSDRGFGFLKPSIEFFNRISRDNKLVLRTAASSHIIFGDDFEFYQAAVLGDNTGLRGYRNERFAGEQSLVFNGDLRYSFNQFRTSFLPLQIGIYGGYDYGRVWIDGDPNNEWQDSVGGGLWINSINALNANVGLFSSDDGIRFTFRAGFSF